MMEPSGSGEQRGCFLHLRIRAGGEGGDHHRPPGPGLQGDQEPEGPSDPGGGRRGEPCGVPLRGRLKPCLPEDRDRDRSLRFLPDLHHQVRVCPGGEALQDHRERGNAPTAGDNLPLR